MNKIISILKYLVGWPLSFVALFFIIKLIYSNASSLYRLKDLNIPLLLIGVVFFLIYFFLRSILWYELIKEKGNKLSYKTTAYFWEVSEIRRYIPGNIWSFISRSNFFMNKNISGKDMVSSIFNETILIVISCFAISSFYISFLLKNDFINYLLILGNFLILLFYIFLGKIGTLGKGKIFTLLKSSLLPGLNYNNNFKFYLISLFSFLAFGLANYFSIISVFYLDPKNIVILNSIFVFSLFIGYASLITPMGLGVREGVMTLGLSYFIPISLAGIASIFTRIIFILSEILFLILLIIIKNLKNKIFIRVENFLKKYRYGIFLTVLAFIYVLYFSTASFARYDNFYTGRFDLGNMDQTVWNTIHGRIFQITDPNGTDTISRLSFHADFILILISPLYLIWSNPKMLLLLQTVIVALGSMFVYLIGKKITKNQMFSLVISECFVLNPSLQYANLYDFHPVTLATTFFLGSYYFFITRKYFYFLIFALLAGLTKEEAWLVVAIFGLLIIARNIYENRNLKKIKEVLYGSVLSLTSLIIFYTLVWKIIPYFRGSEHFALAYYSDFGSSASEITKNILFNPIQIFSTIITNGSFSYLFDVLVPLGFISLLSPFALILALPDLLINTLSSNKQLHQIFYQYTSVITPFIFISGIYGAKKLVLMFPKISFGIVCLYIFAATLLAQYTLGPMPGSLKPNLDMFSKQLTYKNNVENFLTSVPKKYNVAATNNLGSHLSRRQNIYTIPVGIGKADIVMFLLNDPFAQPSLPAQKQMAENLLNDPNYTLKYKERDFIAFEKKNLYRLPGETKENNLFPLFGEK